MSTFVYHFTNSFKSWLSLSDPRFNDPQHVLGGLVDPDEDCVLHLGESEQFQHFSWLRRNTVDGLDAHN